MQEPCESWSPGGTICLSVDDDLCGYGDVDVLCYAYAAVYLKCILVKVITLSKKEKGGERQGPKR